MSQFPGEGVASQPVDLAEQDQAFQLSRRHLLGLFGAAGAASLLGCGGEAPPAAPGETASATGTPAAANTARARSGEFAAEPTWVENFDGPLNSNRWVTDGNPAVPGYNNEDQVYTGENAETREGKLVLTAQRQAASYPGQSKKYGHTSAKIQTYRTYGYDPSNSNDVGELPEGLTFEYGRIEATIKLPKGENGQLPKGAWPAFWLRSANQPHATALLEKETADLNGDAKYAKQDELWEEERVYNRDGEIDVMEAYGREPGMIEGTVHTVDGVVEGRVSDERVADASEAFHTYGVDVTPTSIVWTLDGKPYKTFMKPANSDGDPEKWPFQGGNQLYVMLNLAVGGDGGGKVDESSFPWEMVVDNVKFYEYTGAK
jgi:beta-glucanase (GH16 family)